MKAKRTQDYVYFEDQFSGRRRLYENPVEIICPRTLADLPKAFERVEVLRKEGFYLAGYMAYELGFAFEPVLRSLLSGRADAPLFMLGAFRTYKNTPLPDMGSACIDPLHPQWTQSEYGRRFKQVHKFINAGDVYQINLSFAMTARARGSVGAIYQALKSAQPVRYGGVIDMGGEKIATFSPELFFEKTSDHIHMRPMKGTAARGKTEKHDKILAQKLSHDAKNRAENLMIVDLLRNDLSRLAKPGSVKVGDLFSVETYPSLHTMTSTIEAVLKNDTKFEQVLQALFPCGSVTGAPKIRAQEIINDLEVRPRGAYCGALGLIDPDGDMRFNVGIRTLNLHPDNTVTYPVGSGIVVDSVLEGEYAECLLKAAFIDDGFALIETMGWDAETGFMHLDLHMNRLESSALALGFICDTKKIEHRLKRTTRSIKCPHKIRLQLERSGEMHITASLLSMSGPRHWRVSMSKNPRPQTPLMSHKTTKRAFIEAEFERLCPLTKCREVLFFNQDGALCEGSFTNVFVVKGGKMFTPPLSSGLLPGILRQVLLQNGDAQERVLTKTDLLTADAIYIGNSVRGLIPVTLTSKQRI